MTVKPTPESRMRDANDCPPAFALGTVSLGSAAAQPVAAFDYGSDTSRWANDGKCDDPRFEGPGTASTLLDGDSEHDASDYRTAYEVGTVLLR
ncbi:MAG: hypothetical protein MO852_08790 [Candidatus Devosia euplotis]|nr:hypothetical protein [Candidatus Devosia euplotis]